MNWEIPDVQAGFWKGRGTRDQIANIYDLQGHRQKQESSRKTSISAFLTVPKPLTMWITINCGKFWEMGIPDHLTCLLRNLYAGQEATVWTGHGTTNWFQIGKGVRQGCILSPCLLDWSHDYHVVITWLNGTDHVTDHALIMFAIIHWSCASGGNKQRAE